MTVSRALRNHPHVRDALGERIRIVARQLGYHPDPMLSALAAYRSGLTTAGEFVPIAYVSFWATPDGWRKIPHFLRQYEGASQRAAELGYDLQPFWARSSNMDDRQASRVLYNRGIRGLLLAPIPAAIGHLRFEWDLFSCIALGNSVYKPDMHRVAGRPFEGVLAAWRHLRQLGYRRIGLAITRRTDVRALHQWIAAHHFKTQQTKEEDRISTLVWEKSANAAMFLAWLHKERPDAVISFGSGPIEWIRDAGFSVGSEIGYADLDLSSCSGPCAGIYQYPEYIGQCAVEQLNLLLLQNQHGLPEHPRVVGVKPVWVAGPTVERISLAKHNNKRLRLPRKRLGKIP